MMGINLYILNMFELQLVAIERKLGIFKLRYKHQHNSLRVLEAAVMFAEDIFEGGFVFFRRCSGMSVPYFTSNA